VLQPDARQDASRLFIQLLIERSESVPSLAGKAKQRERDVVLQAVLLEQRDDLVSARKAAVHAVMRREAGHVFSEQDDVSGIARQVAGDQVEERGLAGAVRADDQAPLAGATSRETSLMAGRPPNDFLRFWRRSAATVFSPRGRPRPA